MVYFGPKYGYQTEIWAQNDGRICCWWYSSVYGNTALYAPAEVLCVCNARRCVRQLGVRPAGVKPPTAYVVWYEPNAIQSALRPFRNNIKWILNVITALHRTKQRGWFASPASNDKGFLTPQCLNVWKHIHARAHDFADNDIYNDHWRSLTNYLNRRGNIYVEMKGVWVRVLISYIRTSFEHQKHCFPLQFFFHRSVKIHARTTRSHLLVNNSWATIKQFS